MPQQALQLCRRCLYRSFSTSIPRSTAIVPTFAPTSSEELNELLSTFRKNVLLPSALTRPQQRLVYKKANAYLLTGPEPATVKLGPETHTLYPLDHMRDEPGTKKTFNKVISIMRETKEWSNIEPWLQGLRLSRRHIKNWQWQRLVRNMVFSGEEGRALHCASAHRYTGLPLNDLNVLREMLLGGLARAIRARNQAEDDSARQGINAAASHIATTYDLLFQPAHAVANDATPLYNRPEVIGFMVLASALKGPNAKEELQRHAAMLLRFWAKKEVPQLSESAFDDANNALLTWVPVLRGLQLAEKAFAGEPLEKDVTNVKREIEGWVRSSVDIVQSHSPASIKRRGLELYKEVGQLGP